MAYRIKTFSTEMRWSDLPDDCTLPQFFEFINDLVRDIPEAERRNIKVDWDTNYDEPDTISFEHYRDETEAEEAKRNKLYADRAAAARQQKENEERRTLAALKAKYEDGKP